MILEEGQDLDSTIAVPAATLVSVTLHDRRGDPIAALRVDWEAHDHGVMAPAFSYTDLAGKASAKWTFGADTGQHRATARARGFADVTLTARDAIVVSPLLLRELRPLQLLTYDGSGETVHPDYLGVDAPGFARTFLALTPYKSGDATFENPTVYASADMLRWRVPTGAPNPLVLPGAFYLSDPDIVYDPALAELRLYYRQVGESNTILLIRSRDAVNWTVPEPVIVAPNPRDRLARDRPAVRKGMADVVGQCAFRLLGPHRGSRASPVVRRIVVVGAPAGIAHATRRLSVARRRTVDSEPRRVLGRLSRQDSGHVHNEGAVLCHQSRRRDVEDVSVSLVAAR